MYKRQIVELPCQFDKYVVKNNDVVSSGTITVQRTCNICHVYGQLTLTGKATAWLELTSDEFVLPAIAGSNQYMYISVNIGWGTASTAPAVLRLSPAGNLVIQYGQAGTCNFSFTYICEGGASDSGDAAETTTYAGTATVGTSTVL